jgi:DNA adenine methylase
MNDERCPTVIPYMGGKVHLSRKLITMIPPHKVYMEVFAGGLSMFFRKKKAQLSIVNDLNSDIANLYLVLSYPELFQQFLHRAYWLISSREIYNIASEQMIEELPSFCMPDVRRAVLFFYYIKLSFNNRYFTGWSVQQDWTHDAVEFLKESRRKLEGTAVECLDYRKLLHKHKHRKEMFIYLDPPYVVTDNDNAQYYKYNFDIAEHSEMFDSINALLEVTPDTKIMISYDNYEIVRELYKDWIITEMPVKHSTKLGTTSIELVITNYKTNVQEDIFGD